MKNSIKKIHSNNCPVCGSDELIPLVSCKDYFATKEVFQIYKCKNCGFALTQDFPAEAQMGKYYDVPTYISHSDTQKGIINTLYHWARAVALRSKSKTVCKYASKKTGMLLDIGSGTGYFLNRMRSLKWIVTGIEKSDKAKKYAKEKFNLNSQSSDYLYDIPEKAKDVITMWHVLEHLELLNGVMQHIHNILKDDGIAIIALPNKDSYDAASYGAYWAAYDTPRHLWHFSPSDFERLANKHGLELTATKPLYFDAFYISMLSEKNKGTALASLVGFVKGGVFFLRSLGNTNRCSSLVYILKKKIIDFPSLSQENTYPNLPIEEEEVKGK